MNKSWGIAALVLAALYWLQAVLIPMAILLTFLLSPLVGILQRRHAGLVTVLVIFMLLEPSRPRGRSEQ